MPLMTLKKALAEAQDGQEIEVVFTCPEATVVLPEYCENNGIEIVGFDKEKKHWKFVVRK
ncbi:SirA-like protein [Slackia heliotrinireducens]|jgi:tRNA 2-thiouridine synthesizing protein A|nr:SirA-like protein [Slackia heliotrinireducens]